MAARCQPRPHARQLRLILRGRPARLLRRRRPRHPDRRAGAREVRRAGLCAPRDRPQPARGRVPRAERRHFCGGAGRDPGNRRTCDLFGTRRAARPSRRPPRPRNLFYLDATCPLVSKVHVEAARPSRRAGLEIVLIGHAGHPEVIGTMGQLPAGAVTLIETVDDARALHAARSASGSPTSPRPRSRSTTPPRSSPSCRQRFPAIVGPHKEDICYATTNRQAAVKAIAPRCDAADRGRRAQQLQLAAPGRGGRARRLPQGAAGAARRRDPLGRSSPASPRSASPPAPRRPRCWSTRSSRPSATAST